VPSLPQTLKTELLPVAPILGAGDPAPPPPTVTVYTDPESTLEKGKDECRKGEGP
jgi:hypothetical protein